VKWNHDITTASTFAKGPAGVAWKLSVKKREQDLVKIVLSCDSPAEPKPNAISGVSISLRVLRGP